MRLLDSYEWLKDLQNVLYFDGASLSLVDGGLILDLTWLTLGETADIYWDYKISSNVLSMFDSDMIACAIKVSAKANLKEAGYRLDDETRMVVDVGRNNDLFSDSELIDDDDLSRVMWMCFDNRHKPTKLIDNFGVDDGCVLTIGKKTNQTNNQFWS